MALQIILTYQSSTNASDVITVSFDPVTKAVQVSVSLGGTVSGIEPTVGAYAYSECSGFTLDRVRYDGADVFTYDPENNSAACGFTDAPEHPAAGTVLREECYGLDKYEVLADGEGGELQGQLLEANSTDCGYTPPPPPPVYGCTDPDATNYDPAANTDDGTCVYPPPVYHAVGGILPNPISYIIAVDPLHEGEPKLNHFIRATLYNHADDSEIGTMQARVRNGQAKIDVASYLRPLVKTSFSDSTEIVSVQEDAVLRFYIGYVELYNGTETEETLIKSPARYAVEAALDGYGETLDAYLLK